MADKRRITVGPDTKSDESISQETENKIVERQRARYWLIARKSSERVRFLPAYPKPIQPKVKKTKTQAQKAEEERVMERWRSKA